MPRSRRPGSLHEGLDFLQGQDAIFVGVHCLENPLVGSLKLLQGDRPVTVAVHHGEEHPHHHAGMHTARTHHASAAHHAHSSKAVPVVLPLLRALWLLHHWPLLSTRSDSAARQNESRRREHLPAELAMIASYAHGIGPSKRNIVPQNSDGSLSAPTALVADAHKAGLVVHPYTFRDEPEFLAPDYRLDPIKEYLQFYMLGVDGVFSDFGDTAMRARNLLWR